MAEADFGRFVTAQAPVYDIVLAELRQGRKQSHWMWFIFPQLVALGRSAAAKYYGVQDAVEAAGYLAHPLLGSRLEECTRALLQHRDRPLEEMLGAVDALKFRSSMTLFGAAAPAAQLFEEALDAFCDGRPDPLTLELLALNAPPST